MFDSNPRAPGDFFEAALASGTTKRPPLLGQGIFAAIRTQENEFTK